MLKATERGGIMLGARIAALRRHAGLSQAELAQKLQISPSAIGMYEQGRREPSTQTLVVLARLFGVSTDYLLTGEPAEQERAGLAAILLERIDAADRRLDSRPDRPFSRQELATLFAAILLEP
jgi:transcriptional regulator with XRE-family HTH domain